MIRMIVTCVLALMAVCVNNAIAEDIEVTARVGNEEYIFAIEGGENNPPYFTIDDELLNPLSPNEFIQDFISNTEDVNSSFQALCRCLYVASSLQFNIQNCHEFSIHSLIEFCDSVGLTASETTWGYRSEKGIVFEFVTKEYDGNVSLSFLSQIDASNYPYDHHPELTEIEDNIVTRVELEIKNDLDTLNLIILEFPVVP